MISWRKHYKKGLIAISLLLSTGASVYAQGDPKKGQDLFKTNCTACHALDKQVIGPALGGVVDRLKKEQNLETDWLHKWIKDNKALRASGDKYAIEVFEKFKKVEMTQFPSLTDQDIADLLEYTTNPPKAEPVAGEVDPNSPESLKAAKDEKNNSSALLISLAAVGGLLLLLLFRLTQLVNLQRKSAEISKLDATRIHSLGEFYQKYNTLGKVIMGALAAFAFYGIWNWLMWVGVYKGYQPEQPIYFSHKIHAGENKIDCQTCHSSAKYGKVSEIPSVNVCMNCHKGIPEYKGKYLEEGKSRDFYTAEIKKIYQAAGWDEASQTYTGKTKPIEWVRIHNMPDFVYFNHSQHVVAGEQSIIKAKKVDVVCKACHGQVQEMDKVQMANNFTMGWCIDCHRTTEVDMTNNYNKEYYQKLHDKLKKQYGTDKITVDAIGGLECGKCHY